MAPQYKLMLNFALALVLVSISASSGTVDRTTCAKGLEIPCDSGTCVFVGSWCDSNVDCDDSSDEKYCSNPDKPSPSCKDIHFNCSDGSCIPLSGRCDGTADCPDDSDEACGNFSFSDELRPTTTRNEYSLAAVKALKWLVNRRQDNFGWGEDTPRALTAYALTSLKFRGLEAMRSMTKELNVHLAMTLVRENTTNTQLLSSDLALFVNALLATCQNSENFEGRDLVQDLRKMADDAMKSQKRTSPFVYLTLCLAGRSEHKDFSEVYHTLDSERPDFYAVGVLALICLASQRENGRRFETVHQLLDRSVADYAVANYSSDVYVSSLVAQAVNAARKLPEINSRLGNYSDLAQKSLLKMQFPDGSFGNLFSTYSAIPALLGMSLLDINDVCIEKLKDGTAMNSIPKNHLNIRYSLWITGNSDTQIHSRELIVGSNWTFLDVMNYASTRSKVFNFSFQNETNGVMVYSLAGIPNDSEKGNYWELYIDQLDTPEDLNLLRSKTRYTGGLEKLKVKEGSNFVFLFKSEHTTV